MSRRSVVKNILRNPFRHRRNQDILREFLPQNYLLAQNFLQCGSEIVQFRECSRLNDSVRIREISGFGAVFPLSSNVCLDKNVSKSVTNPWLPLIPNHGYAAKAKKGKKGQRGKGTQNDEDEDEIDVAPTRSKAKSGGGVIPAADPKEVILTAKQKMLEAMESASRELSKLRTGRASPGMLDHVVVDAYGTPTPLNRVASVVLRDSQTLLVNLHDPNLLTAVDKGIRESPMGLNPSTEGSALSVSIPRLTTDVRQAMGKLVQKAGEAAKVNLRRVRKEGMDNLKLVSEGVSEDLTKRQEKEIQDLTNKFTKQVDDACKVKEKEILSG